MRDSDLGGETIKGEFSGSFPSSSDIDIASAWSSTSKYPSGRGCMVLSRSREMDESLCACRCSWEDERGDAASGLEGLVSVVSKNSMVFSTAGRGPSVNEDGGERDRGVPCSDVGDSDCIGGTTGVTGGVRGGRKRLRGDPLSDFADSGLGIIRSGGILSPKKRASFERRLRRWRVSRPSFHFSHSSGEGRNDLEVEMEKSDDVRFLNEDTEGLGT